jgi:hypothetical protein
LTTELPAGDTTTVARGTRTQEEQHQHQDKENEANIIRGDNFALEGGNQLQS